MIKKRLFLGGLYHEVNANSLTDRFAAYGQISNVDIKTKCDSDGNPFKTFAYVDIEVASEDDVKKCVSAYSGSKWKGFTLSVQEARPSFMQRLQEEREKANAQNKTNAASSASAKPPLSADPPTKSRPIVIKDDGKKVRNGGGVGVVKVNPKFSNKSVRRVGLEEEEDKSIASLTWTIEEKRTTMNGEAKGEGEEEENANAKKKEKTKKRKAEGEEGEDKEEKENEEKKKEKKKKKSPTISASSDNGVDSLNGDLFQGLTFSRDGKVLTAESDKSSSVAPSSESKSTKKKEKKAPSSSKDDDTATPAKPIQFGDASTDSSFLLSVKASVSSSLSSVPPVNGVEGKEAKESYDSDCSADTDEIISRAKKRKLAATPSSSPAETSERKKPEEVVGKSVERESLFEGVSFGDDGKVEKEREGGVARVDSDDDMVDGNVDDEESDGDDDNHVEEVDDDDEANDTASTSFVFKGFPFKLSFSNTSANDEDDDDDDYGDDDGEDVDNDESDSNSDEELTANQKKKRSKRTVLPSFAGIGSLAPVASELDDRVETPTGMLAIAIKFAEKTTAVGSETAKAFTKTAESEAKSPTSKEIELFSKRTELPSSKTESSPLETTASSKETQPSSGGTESSSKDKPSSTTGTEPSSKETEPTEGKKPKKAKKKDKDDTSSSSADPLQQRNVTTMEKRKLADQKRLEALKESKERNQKRAELLQSALKSVDGSDAPAPNKKIIFDSDDDNDYDQEANATGPTLIPSDSSVGHNQSAGPTARKIGLSLFDESDDDEEEDEGKLARAFEPKPHFEGEAGQKLMALQAKFKNDSRFKMDVRFLEEEDEDEGGEEAEAEGKVGAEEETDEADLKEEKARALDILSRVLGGGGESAGGEGGEPSFLRHKEEEKKKKKKLLTAKEMNALRYDPDADDRAESLVIKEDEKKKEEKKNKRKEEKSAEVEEDKNQPPEVSAERFYEVDVGSLKTLFKTKDDTPTAEATEDGADDATIADKAVTTTEENHSAPENPQTFTFGFSFTDESAADAIAEDAIPAESSAPLDAAKALAGNESNRKHVNAFSFSSDEEDEDGKDEVPIPGDDANDALGEDSNVSNSFFFLSLTDSRLKEGREFFRAADATEETIREDWSKDRPALVEAYKLKHRHAARRRRKGKK